MQEFAIYSVIPPEGCAAILWRDASKKVEAATALKLTATDLLKAGLVDEIVKEPDGGAHADAADAISLVDAALVRALAEVSALDRNTRLSRRYEKFRNMGQGRNRLRGRRTTLLMSPVSSRRTSRPNMPLSSGLP